MNSGHLGCVSITSIVVELHKRVGALRTWGDLGAQDRRCLHLLTRMDVQLHSHLPLSHITYSFIYLVHQLLNFKTAPLSKMLG